jgi:putative transposase
MSNHVHLIVVPQQPESLPLALKHTHGRYAAYFNARHVSSGHVWQGRYYSCPLDTPHFCAALRYTELNPVRAGMVEDPVDYPWSSAAAHCGCGAPDPWLEMKPFSDAWDPALWREYLSQAGAVEEADAIRKSTHSGRPLGTPDFVAQLEKALRRRLAPLKGGRPPKEQLDERQTSFIFRAG